MNTVIRLIDPKLPIEKLYKQLKGLEASIGLTFGKPSVGAGQLQWTLEGEGWRSFSELNESEKHKASLLFNDRKKLLQKNLGGSSLSATLLTFPEEKFLYFRNVDSQPGVGITCWGYRYPHIKDGKELEKWIKKVVLQEVAISFSWAGKQLPDFPFKFNTHERYTGKAGKFLVDQPLPVGNMYSVETMGGREFTFTVIEGQRDYDFDLTEYFTIKITAKKDGNALADREVTVCFHDINRRLKTDLDGHISLRLPFECTATGLVKEPQKDCVVTCDGQNESGNPSVENNQLKFLFQFFSPVEEEIKEEIKEDKQTVTIPPATQVKEDKKDTEAEIPEIPQFIGITILDYGGYPVKEMEVTLFLPQNRTEKFVTDKNGRIEFPKDWLPNKKGKINIKFTATTEYQETHDLHRNKKRNKK